MATGQRWYCPVCNARYRTTFGLIVEILGPSGPDSGHYATAEFPPHAFLDGKFMMLEEQLKATTHRVRHAGKRATCLCCRRGAPWRFLLQWLRTECKGRGKCPTPQTAVACLAAEGSFLPLAAPTPPSGLSPLSIA